MEGAQVQTSAPPAPPVGYPGQPPVAPPPPSPSGRRRGVAIAAAIIVILAVVLSGALYFLVFANAKPTIQLTAAAPTQDGFIVVVTGASQAVSTSSYRVNLLAGGTGGTAVALTSYMNITISTDIYLVLYVDVNRDNLLGYGDGFGVIHTGGLTAGTLFTFQLLWSDGSIVATATYQAPADQAPQVTLSSPQAIANGFSFQVASVSQAKAISNFKVNVMDGSATGTAVTLTSSMSFLVAGSTWTVDYTDVDLGGSLTAGDQFAATPAGGPQGGHIYQVLLLWSDGSVLATAYYYPP